MDSQLFEYARCPVTKSPLTPASSDMVDALNQRIEAKQLRDRMERFVETKLEAGLVNADKSLLYPVKSGIPTLIPDEAIALEQLEAADATE